MRYGWRRCVAAGLLSSAMVTCGTVVVYAGDAPPVRMTLAEFLSELEATKQAGGAPRAVSATATTSAAGPAEGGAGLDPPRPSPVDPEGEAASAPGDSASSRVVAPPAPAQVAAQPATDDDQEPRAALNGSVAVIPAVAGTTGPFEEAGNSAATLDLSTAVRQAVGTHPAVGQSLGRLYATLEDVDVARAGYFPRVSSALGSGYRRAASRPWDSFTISASQMLYDFGKVSSSVDVAASTADRNRAMVLMSMDEIARDTATAFIEMQRYQALLAVAREQTAAIADIQSLAETRSRLGASSRSDALQALARHEAAIATELELQAQLDLWRRALQTYTGRDVPAMVDDRFPGAIESSCQVPPGDFSQVPQVMMAEAELTEARARIARARADYFPTVSVNANYGNLNNPANVAFNPVLDDREFSVALSLDSTLYQGGAARARRRAAEYSVQAAQAGREAALLEVTRGFREARDQSRSFDERLRYLESRHDNVVSTQELYRQQYLSLGTRTLLDILNTEQEIHQARFDQQQTLHDLRRLRIACLYNAGGLRDAFAIDSRPARGIRIRP